MKDYLASISEETLRKAVGDAAVDRAARHLLTGKVQERLRWPDGSLEAFWDPRLDDIAMHAENQTQGLVISCTCGELGEGNVCEHVNAMLLAWATDPGSFEMGEEYDDEEDDDNDDEYDYDLDEPVGPRSVNNAVISVAVDLKDEYVELLNHLTVRELREIAARRGIEISGNRKDPIVETLAEVFSGPGYVEEVWQGLSPGARLLAGVLVFVMSSVNEASTGGLWKAARKWGMPSEDDFQQDLEELRLSGLAFVTSPDTISVPSMLPQLLPADPDFTPAYPSLENAGQSVGAGPRPALLPIPQDFIQLLTRMLLLLQAGGERFKPAPKEDLHPVLKSYTYLQGWPYDAKELDALQKDKNIGSTLWTHSFRIGAAPSPLEQGARRDLAASLGVPESQVDFALHLLQRQGLLEIKRGQALRIDQGKMGAWLQSEPLERANNLLTDYANLDSWTEFDLAFTSRPEFILRRSPRYSSMISYEHMLTLLAASRRYLIWQVRRQPAGRWTDFEALLNRARLLPLVTGAFSANTPWFFELKNRKLDAGKPEDWKILYGVFAEAILIGPLYWLGLVDVALKKDRLAAFRLTDFGAALLLQRTSYQPPTEDRSSPALEFAPGGSLRLHVETAAGELIGLLTLLGEASLAKGGSLAYQASPAGAAKAFAAGWTLERIRAVLGNAAASPLPPALDASLEKWWQDYGSLQLYEDVAMLELGDDYALNELLAGTSLSRYLLYRFSPRLVALRPEGAELLRDELVKKGYTPGFQAGAGVSSPG